MTIKEIIPTLKSRGILLILSTAWILATFQKCVHNAVMLENFKILNRGSEEFPKLLTQIPTPPERLYIRGNLDPDEVCFAIVGTRKPTLYGREMAKYLSHSLTKSGFTIVSGLALGIDSIAHKACLEAGGRTVAVLGSGINDIYPEENRKLGEQIIDQGALVSEFEPDEPSYPGNFPQRNRIISGMSLGVLVVEAGEKSGALITASYAAEQNREVFAIPGPINSPLSAGTNKLIQEGAKLVLGPEDVINEFRNLKLPFKKEIAAFQLDKDSQSLLILLNRGAPMDIDTLARVAELPVHRVQTSLTTLELNRSIKRLANGTYRIWI